MSELLVRKVTGALLGFKLGNKTGAEVMVHLNALKKVNPGMAEDLEKRYIALAKEKSLS